MHSTGKQDTIYFIFKKNVADTTDNRRIRTNQSDSEVTVRRSGKIIQRILFAQSGASIRRVACKWSGETRFPGALLLL